MGSWNTIAISRPRSLAISGSLKVVSSLDEPSGRVNKTLPPAMRAPARSTKRITLNAVTDLPDPDSPTMASV